MARYPRRRRSRWWRRAGALLLVAGLVGLSIYQIGQAAMALRGAP